MENIELNEFQTPLSQLNLDKQPDEVKEQFLDFFYNVPFIQNLTSKDRKRAKDLPRDDKGRIIIDITHPHILEDMDYFRPAAIYYQQHGCYTKLRPNDNPNSEFGKWITEEVRRCREGYVRESDGEWITGDYYYFLNYAPMQLVKKEDKNSKKGRRVFDFPNVWEGHYLKSHALNQAREQGHHYAELSSRGRGKAHPYDEFVYTTTGIKKWGDIQIGDYVYGDDGKPTKIIDIPFDDVCPIYEITLANGRKVKCSEGHLWKVKSHCRNSKEFIIISTKELLQLYKRPRNNKAGYELDCTIPIHSAVEFEHKDTKVDPYVFGLLLGDRCFRVPNCNSKTYFTSSDEDFETYKKYIPYNWIKYNNTKCGYNLNIPHFKDILETYGLYFKKSEEKFIPEEYKINSIDVRINLLKGILDSDGTVTPEGKIEIVITSKKLIEDIKWICDSLGINYTKERIKHTFYYDKNHNRKKCLDAYRLSIFSNIPLFNLPRKLEIWNNKPKTNYALSKYKGSKITNIEYIGEQKAKCITVDNESHCYLINNFITTHNSFYAAAMLAKRFILGESKEVNKKVVSYITADDKKYLVGGDQTLDKFQFDIDWASNNMEWPSKRLINSLSNMQWIMGYKDMDSGTNKGTLNSVIGVTSKDDPQKLRGTRGVLYVIEEFGTFGALLDLISNLRPSVEDGEDVFGTIVAYGCCCAGTKVWTGDGRNINIEDLKSEDTIVGYGTGINYTGDNVITYTEGITIEPIGKLITLGTKQCLKITFKSGNVLQCSKDHPVLVSTVSHPRKKDKPERRYTIYTNTFKQAQNLKIGDKVCKCRRINVFGKDTLFDARLVGMLIGDGSYHFNQTPCLSSEDIEIQQYVKERYETSLSNTHITKKNKVYEELRVKNICKHLRSVGIYGQTKDKKRLPNNFQCLTKEDTILLLSGLYDTDGCIHVDKNNDKQSYIALTQGNIEILKQIQILWKKFGVNTCIVKCKPHISEFRKDKNVWYNLLIKGQRNLFYATEALNLIVKHKKENIEYIRQHVLEYDWKKQTHLNPDIILDSIVKIEDIGEQKIYNLSAGASHTYLANDIITHNTAGDKESDFSSAQEIVYNPEGYNFIAFDNVYDKVGQGKRKFAFFFPGYLNMANCYDSNGNSDVTKALLSILKDRYFVKYHSTNINAISKRIAEIPITPQEAMLKSRGNIFPVTQLTQRLNEMDNNPTFHDSTYVGELVQNSKGEIIFQPTKDEPIREYPIKNNKEAGAIEIWKMPEKDSYGKVMQNRYIIGHDPVDQDAADTASLTSTFVLDTFTDQIVAEYTGRQQFADDNFEIVRKLCLFYNAKCLYEQNKKGLFAYFQKFNCLWLLKDTPQYLKDVDVVKAIGYGNNAKGVNATLPVNNYANERIRDWLLKPVTSINPDTGEETTVPNLAFIRSRALLKELIAFNPDINVDRVRALGMVMLYREEMLINGRGTIDKKERKPKIEDEYFSKNYDLKFGISH